MTKIIANFIFFMVLFVANSPAYSSVGKVCVDDEREAIRKYYKWSDHEVQLMARVRGLSLPRVSPTLDRAIPDYLSSVPNSALIAYGIDNDVICAFLWRWDRRARFVYVRQPYQHGTLERLARSLAQKLGVESTLNKRAGIRRDVPQSQVAVTQEVEQESLNSLISELSKIFFPKKLRKDLEQVRHLSLVPVRGMSSVPISILSPLGDKRKTVDLFSVNFLAFLNDVVNGANSNLALDQDSLIIGNPRPSHDKQWNWIPLPGAEQEAIRSHSIFKGTLLIRREATKSSVIQRLPNVELIHFASHGYTDPNDALDGSFLVLGDGRLTATEIQNLNLKPNRPLVILSACHTGEGFVMNAGVVGLARSFQKAGASNTIMSLWAVDDAATLALMTYFFDLLDKNGPSEGLRLAKLKLKAKYPSPSHWAAFNVYGNHRKRK